MKIIFKIKTGDGFKTVIEDIEGLPEFNIGDQVFFQDKFITYEITGRSWTIHHDNTIDPLIYIVTKVS
jgi:hypothetical protein